jgi:bacillithiol biosynthesis cysteine-adding enzyme BshC
MLERVNLNETPLINPLALDYLNQDAFLKDFHSYSNELSNYEKLINAKSNFPSDRRNLLVDELLHQYVNAGIELKENSLVKKHILDLGNENTFTVTTGHQLVLFGGPLFTTYKILSTLKLAAELNKAYPQKRIIPIFWLASEDHDYEEIKNTYVNGETLVWNTIHDAEPVGNLVLDGFENLIAELEQILPNSAQKTKHLKIIRDSYQDGFSLSKATLRYFHQVFEDWGLVIIEPSNPLFKAEIKSLMISDIIEQNSFKAQLVSDRILSEKYTLQIGAREVNFFYFTDSGKRILIKKTQKGFNLADSSQSFTQNEIEELIEKYPERFSPNVNLRPLYQETILPNLAYIGGPAEVAYWLQLKSIFDTNKLAFPAVVLRMMHLFLPPGLENRMNRFGLKAKDALLKTNDLSAKYFETIGESSIENQINLILNTWQELYELSSKLNDELQASILAEKLKDKSELKALNKEYKAKRLSKHNERLQKLMKVRAEIYPAGILQERIETLMWYECLMDKSLVEELYQNLNVFEPELLMS